MDKDKGVKVANCPIGQEYCYQSCHWWTEKGCSYDAYCRKEREDLKAMRNAGKVHREK